MSGARLRNANMSGAILTGADLTSADVTGADMRGAVMVDTLLGGCNLKAADTTGSLNAPVTVYIDNRPARRTRLRARAVVPDRRRQGRTARLRRRRLPPGAQHAEALPDHPGSRGRGVLRPRHGRRRTAGRHLVNADLRRCNLEGADLRGARLMGARLTHANLTGAHLGPLDLGGGPADALGPDAGPSQSRYLTPRRPDSGADAGNHRRQRQGRRLQLYADGAVRR
ncbi:MAG: pentapeptide repeat-containing protein [Asticcacaulis sp.]